MTGDQRDGAAVSDDHGHSPGEIRARLSAGPGARYGRDLTLGGIDGVVTTFAIVSGVVGASLSTSVVLILGVANILADGFSMAASNYSGTRTDIEDADRIRDLERRHVETMPEGEVREVREIFRRKGFSGPDLDRAVAVITADRETWIATMLAEEYGISPQRRSALRAALHTFAAFVLCGFIPLMPFAIEASIFEGQRAFVASIVLAALTFVGIGAARSRWSTRRWWQSAASTLFIGLGAGGIAFAIGHALRQLIDVA